MQFSARLSLESAGERGRWHIWSRSWCYLAHVMRRHLTFGGSPPLPGLPLYSPVKALPAQVYTVSQIAFEIRDMVERKFWISGSKADFFKASTAGHLYFTLKDDKAHFRRVFRSGASASVPAGEWENLSCQRPPRPTKRAASIR